ncbi:MAG: helix-turn-helix domain-containing protein [Candidatus Obscuribacterales bacterium]
MAGLDPKVIGKRLESLRESRKLSQRALAREAKIAQSAISDFEAGKRIPTPKMLQKLLSFFAVDPAELLAGAQVDPAFAKRRFLIRHIQERLEHLPMEEVSMVAQFIERLAKYQQLMLDFQSVEDSETSE